MLYVISAAALLHLVFMFAEMFPWELPLVLKFTLSKVPPEDKFNLNQQRVVASIVHNAGIYNGIIAGGFIFAAVVGTSALDVAKVLFFGSAIAGIFGAFSLRSPIPGLQAVLGVVGYFLT